VAPDGSILLSGLPTQKLDPRGIPDVAFGEGGRYSVFPTLSATTDGVGGMFATSGGPSGVLHLDARGRLDLEFGVNGFAVFPSGGASVFAREGDGELVGARYAGDAGPGFPSRIEIAKLDGRGRSVEAFGEGGSRRIELTQWRGSVANGLSIASDAAGNVYVAGVVRDSPALFVIKLDQRGNLAADYVGDGIWIGAPCDGPPGFGAPALAVDVAGSVLVGANCLPGGSSAGPGIMKLDPRGMTVAGFRDMGRQPGLFGVGIGAVRAIVVRANGDIYASGSMRSSAAECADLVVAKLRASGESAGDFGQGGIARFRDNDGEFRYLAFDSQGRLYAGGETEGDCAPTFGGPPFAFVVYRLTP